jgi:hypothetical protein
MLMDYHLGGGVALGADRRGLTVEGGPRNAGRAAGKGFTVSEAAGRAAAARGAPRHRPCPQPCPRPPSLPQNVRGGRVRLASIMMPEMEFNHADKVRIDRIGRGLRTS